MKPLDLCAGAILLWAVLSFPVAVWLGRRLKERNQELDVD